MAPPGYKVFSEILMNGAGSVLTLICHQPKSFSHSYQHTLTILSFSHFFFAILFHFSSLLFPRLCPEDLNSSVLEYMTETLGYSLSEIMHTLTANRPSAIMASYHLLLSKFNKSQKGSKAGKVYTY